MLGLDTFSVSWCSGSRFPNRHDTYKVCQDL